MAGICNALLELAFAARVVTDINTAASARC